MEQEELIRTLELTENSRRYLKTVRDWTSFFSILGFIMMGAGSIIFPFVMASSMSRSGSSLYFIGLIYLVVILAMYFFPVLYLYRFSTYSKEALAQLDSLKLETAFRYLKMHYKYLGIVLLIVLSIYIIAGLVMLISWIFSHYS